MSRNRSDASVQHTLGPTARSSADAYADSLTSGSRSASNDTPFVLGGGVASVATSGDLVGSQVSGTELAGGSDGTPMVITTDGPGPV